MIVDLYKALTSDLPFKQAWLQARHTRYWHHLSESTLISKTRVEDHKGNTDEFVYSINIWKCNECGLEFHDDGMETRYGASAWLRNRRPKVI